MFFWRISASNKQVFKIKNHTRRQDYNEFSIS